MIIINENQNKQVYGSSVEILEALLNLRSISALQVLKGVLLCFFTFWILVSV